MVKYASTFQFVMGLRPGYFYVVKYGDGTAGVYLNHKTGFTNKFKTGLAARGTEVEIEEFLKKHGPPSN